MTSLTKKTISGVDVEVQVFPNIDEMRHAVVEIGGASHAEVEFGVAFNFESLNAKFKRTTILLNAERLDVETITHEVRHALFFAYAQDGVFTLDVRVEAEEESFNAEIDRMTATFVSAIEVAVFGGKELPYIWRRE